VLYRVVYDVLNDTAIPGRMPELVWLGFAVAWTAIWFGLNRILTKTSARKSRTTRGGFLVGGVFICIGIWLAASQTYPLFVDQRLCKDWARTGNFHITDGRVTALIRERGKYPPTHFQVGNASFTYYGFPPRTGGFHGIFTESDAHNLSLREGLAVRIAHHNGRILRIEVGASG
jgi:hypothetical protein